MPITRELKRNICAHILELLNEKAETAREEISSAKEARDNETKTSVGDKYETGREMMQMEIDKSQMQLSKILDQIKDISNVDLSKSYTKIAYGSLVETNAGNYFISVGFGKITLGETEYYAISLASPIGNALKDKETGAVIQFQGREIAIKTIV